MLSEESDSDDDSDNELSGSIYNLKNQKILDKVKYEELVDDFDVKFVDKNELENIFNELKEDAYCFDSKIYKMRHILNTIDEEVENEIQQYVNSKDDELKEEVIEDELELELENEDEDKDNDMKWDIDIEKELNKIIDS